jgi:hypothetical protein
MKYTVTLCITFVMLTGTVNAETLALRHSPDMVVPQDRTHTTPAVVVPRMKILRTAPIRTQAGDRYEASSQPSRVPAGHYYDVRLRTYIPYPAVRGVQTFSIQGPPAGPPPSTTFR